METMRPYKDIAEIAVGDVISCFGTNHAFSAAIIKRIDDDGTVHLVRPMVKIDLTGGDWMHCERYTTTLEAVLKFRQVYTRTMAGEKDNRYG